MNTIDGVEKESATVAKKIEVIEVSLEKVQEGKEREYLRQEKLALRQKEHDLRQEKRPSTREEFAPPATSGSKSAIWSTLCLPSFSLFIHNCCFVSHLFTSVFWFLVADTHVFHKALWFFSSSDVHPSPAR
jgi:hypothetical protein